MSDELHRPLYTADLLVNALNQQPERPLLQLLGEGMLTVGDMRDATSQYVQALRSFGVAKGVRVALVSANRPEVLHASHAVQLLASIYIALHPLSGLADHLNIVEDAGVDILIFDAARFGERAAELQQHRPGLRLLAFGDSPLAEDLCAIAEALPPERLVAPKVEPSDIMRLAYSGGTTGKPKSLWLHSGDVAVRDPGGFLRIVDRTKDMIVTGGFNVYPREIEDVLSQHPAVAQAAVIGVPHPKWGEAVTALIVLRGDETVSPDELIALVAARKGAFQAPKTVEFIDAIPQTPVGKPDKKALRAMFAARELPAPA